MTLPPRPTQTTVRELPDAAIGDGQHIEIHPLAESAGGDFYHKGGKHWSSQNDVEWLTIKAWVMRNTLTTGAERHPRIIQTLPRCSV